MGTLHVARRGERRQAVGAGHREHGAPRAVEDQFDRVLGDRLGEEPIVATATPWEALPEHVAEDLRRLLRLRDALRVESRNGRERREYRIAVISPTAPVKPAVFQDGNPGTQAPAPTRHLGLLVEVAVEHHGLVGRRIALRGNVEEEDRRAALEADHLELHPAHRLLRDPRARLLDRGLDVAVLLPLRIEVRRLRGQADVFHELRDDVVVPLAGDAARERGGVGPGRRGGPSGRPERYFRMLPAWRWPGSRISSTPPS